MRYFHRLKQEEQILSNRREEANLFVNLRDLWNLYKILETNDTAYRISRVSAEYYNKAYQDNDRENGLNQQQYDQLIASSVIARKHKEFFPKFDDRVWDRNGRVGQDRDGAILIDELERVCVLVYKRILQNELEIKLTQEKSKQTQKDLDLTEPLLDDEQKEEDRPSIFARIFG